MLQRRSLTRAEFLPPLWIPLARQLSSLLVRTLTLSLSPLLISTVDLSGWVEKKGNKTLGVAGGGWQNRFMVVRKPGNLFYYKDEDVTQEPSGQVDLTLVVNFSIKEKDDDRPSSAVGSTDSVRLDLDLADRVLKLRSSLLCSQLLLVSCLQIQDSRRGFALERGSGDLEGLCQ